MKRLPTGLFIGLASAAIGAGAASPLGAAIAVDRGLDRALGTAELGVQQCGESDGVVFGVAHRQDGLHGVVVVPTDRQLDSVTFTNLGSGDTVSAKSSEATKTFDIEIETFLGDGKFVGYEFEPVINLVGPSAGPARENVLRLGAVVDGESVTFDCRVNAVSAAAEQQLTSPTGLPVFEL